jgi:phospholipid/cholesterol/gamma-HCH transport system substrate-binding protein
METRANYALIGLFTIAVIAAAFGFVFWFSGGDTGQRRQPLRIVFSGSVSGLSKGSAVLFNGIRVGEVTETRLQPDDPRRVLAIIEVDRSTPVRTDTRARLEFSGLTGVGTIALVGGEPGAPALAPGAGETLPTIFADRSDFQDLMETARNLARRADDFLDSANRLVGENRASIDATVRNVERFSQALNDNAPGINRFLAQVGQAAERIGPLAVRLETLTGHIDDLVRTVDRPQVTRIVTNVENFTQALGDSKQAIGEAVRDFASLAKQLNASAPKLDAALVDASNLAKAFDPAKIGRVVDNADRFAQALGNSSADAERAIKEARSIAEKLNKSADRVDDVLKSAQGFLGSAGGEAGKGAFEEVKDAARSVRVLAENLDKRTAALSSGLTRFTNSGLREYEALATEGRRTVNDVGRAARNLEKSPQSLIFGGKPNIPQYSGR